MPQVSPSPSTATEAGLPAGVPSATPHTAQRCGVLWPDDLLEAFCLRMAGQGMCVSRVLMQNNRRYGLEQLAHAHNMADDTLRMMAVQLFRLFESRQSGIDSTH